MNRLAFGALLAIIAFQVSVGAHASAQATVRKDSSGHYRLMGKVDGYPTHFLIDTGATFTSVPPTVAAQAGLSRKACRPVVVNTANGMARGCAYNGQIEFGRISLRGEIHVLPNLSSSVLGMNALKGLSMQQAGEFLTLTQGDPTPSSISITPVLAR